MTTQANNVAIESSQINSSGVLQPAGGGTGVTTSTGSGNNVLSTSPTLVTPVLGTPTSVTLTNATGLPLSTGITGTLPIANGGTGSTSAATVAGTGITVSGTFPNQTITNSAPAVTAGEAKAWVNFNGSGGTIRASYNVSSITVSSAGQYIVNFTNAFSDTNYSAIVSAGTGGSNCPNINAPSVAPTTTTFTFQTFDYSFSNLTAFAYNYASFYR